MSTSVKIQTYRGVQSAYIKDHIAIITALMENIDLKQGDDYLEQLGHMCIANDGDTNEGLVDTLYYKYLLDNSATLNKSELVRIWGLLGIYDNDEKLQNSIIGMEKEPVNENTYSDNRRYYYNR